MAFLLAVQLTVYMNGVAIEQQHPRHLALRLLCIPDAVLLRRFTQAPF
jgi:hypothetical protein